MNLRTRTLRPLLAAATLLLLAPAVPTRSQSVSGASAHAPLTKVADIPLPGPAVRFDYQSLDAEHHRLYIAHMNAGHLIVFDTHSHRVIANLPGFSSVHGVLAVPAIHRVYASVTGEHHLAIVDMATLKTIATAGPITYPDGIAYAPAQHRVFVSDEHGAKDAVINAVTNTLIANIPLGGGAGNTIYDPTSGHILVAVHHLDQLAAINPASLKIIARYPLPGIADPHGIALDSAAHLAFIAGEANHSLAVFDLRTHTLLSTHNTGDDPDVLAFDSGLQRLYVASESGAVSIFQLSGRDLHLIGTLSMPHAHTVSVDPQSHYVYFPLQNINGQPLLRIMKPTNIP
jgi:DNA-binding beta-propeller fold protein YncE